MFRRGDELDLLLVALRESAGELLCVLVCIPRDFAAICFHDVENDSFSGIVRLPPYRSSRWAKYAAIVDGEAFSRGYPISHVDILWKFSISA